MTSPITDQRTCLLTGAHGYLGSRVALSLREQGWRVISLVRASANQNSELRFQLGDSIPPQTLAGAQALIHCAYDFTPRVWDEIHRVNVRGTDALFRSARAAGVKRIIYISSISAYENCRSLYGKAKLETEALARTHGAAVLRPGLIWGLPAAGVFGRLEHQVTNSRFLPLFGGGTQIQYLTHETDLSRHISAWASGNLPILDEPITLAHEQPWTFRQLLEALAFSKKRRIHFVLVPWRAVWLLLKSAEFAGCPFNFRSDSLVSLMHQNPSPSFAQQRRLGLSFRPFELSSQPSAASAD